MARMQSGDEFPQFDQMTSAESIRRIKELENKVNELQNSCLSVIEYKKDIRRITYNYNAAVEKYNKFAEDVCRNIDFLHFVYALLYPFLKSKFMRFLNFFGRWYIYGEDGNVYPNTSTYEKYRPDPWYAKISNRYRALFKVQRSKCNDKCPPMRDPEEVLKMDESASDSSDSENV